MITGMKVVVYIQVVYDSDTNIQGTIESCHHDTNLLISQTSFNGLPKRSMTFIGTCLNKNIQRNRVMK